MLGPATMSAAGIANLSSLGDELEMEMKLAMFSWVALSAPSSVF